jgi:pyruvate/2-oxoglutarate dehydrogenase complex dihydrolipoamide acyltransferase (E2) component
MTVPIQLPDLQAHGETVRVSSWFVEPGDEVCEGHRVVEVLLRGITFDVPSPADGILTVITTTVDTPIQPGNVLGWVTATSNGDAVEEEGAT